MGAQAIGPHAGAPVLAAGVKLDRAQAAMILVHGRGASARDILTLTPDLAQPDWACLAPQASGNTWYPERFTAPLEKNEPWLTSALSVLGSLAAQVKAAGIPTERTFWLGFSQGACLVLEWIVRRAPGARRWGGVAGLSGGLIGPPDRTRDDAGTLAGTPVFLGCSDPDPHIPRERVLFTESVMSRLGAQVTARLYPNMGHTIGEDEIRIVRDMLALPRSNT